MKYCGFVSILLVLMTGCIGTRILNKSDNKFLGNKLGITYLNKQHPVIDTIFPSLNNIYYNEIGDIFTHNGFLITLTDDSLKYENPSIEEIRRICKAMNLDGLIISCICFSHVKKYIYFIPTSQYFDNIFESKLFDKEGSLILKVQHNTKYDVYESVPDNDIIIKTSIQKTVEKLLNELNEK